MEPASPSTSRERLKALLRSRAAEPRVTRISLAQRRLFTLFKLAPESGAYNLLSAFELRGKLQIEALRRALHQLVKRHDALRMVFGLKDGEPVQIVRNDGSFAFTDIDLRAVSLPGRQAEVDAVALGESGRPFDLLAGPLHRFRLLRLDDETHVLLVVVHHIIADAWSFKIFNQELEALYRAYGEGREPLLAPLREQYSDFSLWEHRQLTDEVLERELRYWEVALDGMEPTELPADFPRPPVESHRGATRRFQLPAPFLLEMRRLAREEEVSPFLASLAVFLVLLHRTTGRADVNCGIPVSNRTRSGAEELIGFFVNTVVIRADLKSRPSFLGVLARLKEAAEGIYAHGHLPFDRVVERLRPQRDSSRNPLFQINFQMGLLPPLRLGDLGVETRYEQDYGVVRIDLEFYLGEDGRGIVVYNRDLYSERTIADLAERYLRLWGGAVASPALPVGELPLLGDAERHAIVTEWNDTARSLPGPATIHELFAARAGEQPEAVAAVHRGSALSYGELNRRADRVARSLRARGVGPEVPVGLCCDRSPDLLVALLAILKAGGAYVPIARRQPPDRLAAIVEDSGVSMVLTGRGGVSPDLASTPVGALFVSLSDLDLALPPGEDPLPSATAHSLAYMIYTSGSTGMPKGVLIEHRSAVHLAAAMERLCYRDLAGRRLRVSLNAPIEFDASVQQLLMLTRGHCLVLIPDEIRPDGPAFVRYLAEHQVEALDCTPTHLAVLLDAGLLEAGSGLQKILAAGGAIDRPMWDRLAVAPGIESFDIYGPTECTVNATGQAITTTGVSPRIGGPLDSYTVYLLDRDLRPVPRGVVGEIYIGGAGVGRGYLGRPALTAAAFLANPFGAVPGERLYRTGDLARRLEDEALEFLGRRDDQVKLRGFRVELGEIQARLIEQPGVRQAAVVVQGEGMAATLVAYLVPEPSSPFRVDAIRSALERVCPDYMIPARFVELLSLPLTRSGKLDRTALPRPSLETPAVPRIRSMIEDALLEVWAGAFGRERSEIGLDSNFFELGGHSLLVTRITSRIRALLAVELPPRLVFSHPTPGALAPLVARLRGGAVPAFPGIAALGPAVVPPLSFAQERLWFLDQLEPDLAAYNVPLALRLTGALDRRALESGFRQVVERHAALRTTFAVADGQPTQRIREAVEDIVLPVVDLARLSTAEREAEALRLAARDGATPFRLDTPPLYRLTLLALGPAEHVLLASIHHIITDAWSIRILMQEWSAFYAGRVHGRPALLVAPAVTYADYAAWQRRLLDTGLMERHQLFWRQQLDAVPPVLDLPTDRPRPAAFRYRGDNVLFHLPSGEMRGVAAASAASGVTVFMFLAAAVQLLLSRYSGQDEIWLGSPVANRDRGEIEEVMGLFINMVVLRGRLERGEKVRELLARARQTILDATDHQDFPFERLVEALNPDRSLSHSPLFQSMLTFQSQSGAGLALPGIEVEALTIVNRTAKLDLTFDLAYSGGGLGGRVEYNTDIFDRTTILRLTAGFETLLYRFAAGLDAAVGDVSPMSPAERLALTREWNDTAREFSADLCIHELFVHRVGEGADRIAVVLGEQSVSYGELNRRANRVAHFLASRRRARRARIGIHLSRSIEMIVALLATLKAGHTYVPLDGGYPVDRIQQILAASAAELVLTDRVTSGRLEDLGVPLVRLDGAGWAAYPDDDPEGEVTATDLAYVIFTSGSTGKPKGVVLEHRPVVNLIEWVNRSFDVRAGDGLLFTTSPCFDLSVYDVFGTLAAGATIFLADDEDVRDPERLAEILYSRPVTFWDSAPAALLQLQPFFDPRRGAASSLRLVFLSGDWIPLGLPGRVAETFPRARVIGLGGATEAAIWSNFFPIGAVDRHWKSIPYGRPLQNARYLILDAALEPCLINVAGDLYIGGDCLSIGYLGEPGLTSRQFVPDPFALEPGAVLYATGDRARWRADGNMEFLGRLDAQVKVRGFRIELGEVEAVLESHPAVEKAVALVREDRPGDKRLVAYVQERRDRGAAIPGADAVDAADAAAADRRAELLGWLASKLPEYMVPSHLVTLDRWPVTANGKLDRKALPAPSGDSGTRFIAAENAAQERLAGIWAEVLGVERVGIHDNFFTLGGDSILAIQIVARAHQAGLTIRPRDFFQAQTVAAILPAAREESAARARREPAASETALTPIQRWFFAQELAEPHHFNQAILLEWREPLDVPVLLAALRQLCVDHDALRLRFYPSDAGWRQAVRPPEEAAFRFVRIDLGALAGAAGAADDADTEALEACASALQGGLSFSRGPLLVAGLFPAGAGRPQRLLLAVHHLAIDGVSWRILLDDLADLYTRFKAGAAPPDRSGRVSWMEWAERFDPPGIADRFRSEEPFWLRQGRRRSLERDLPEGRNLAALTETVVRRLSREETGLLERRAPAAYRTQIMDILLAALVLALDDGGETLGLTVDIESHGRSHHLGDADLSETIGWFTSLYPLHLEVERSASIGALLKSIKEQLRAVPRDGVGYGLQRFLGGEAASRLAELPRPEILFNYLGRFEQARLDGALFRARAELTGRDVGGRNTRMHLLEINSLSIDGVFETRWRFSRELFRVSTIERHAEKFAEQLRKILAHCLSPEAGGRTPSDFPLAQVSQEELDRILAAHKNLEDLYPASAMQQGMFFHGELDPEAQVYVQQISLEIHGALDLTAFRSALATASERHHALRTVFVATGGRTLQALLSGHSPWSSLEDWRELPEPERRARVAKLVDGDLKRPFHPAEEPPFRVSLARLEAEVHRLVVTFHHAIMDGWSLGILLEEISAAYRAGVQGGREALPPAGPARDHAAWLAERDVDGAREFWRRYLAGFGRPNPLARPREAGENEPGFRLLRRVLSPALVAGLERFARAHRLTQSSILQAAWTLLVGRYSGDDDVVVGMTTSGREGELAGVDKRVGLFINTLPLRIAIDGDSAVGPWLAGVQRDILAVRQHEHSSLIEVQAESALPPGQPLFESTVVVVNYPFREELLAQWLGHRVDDVQLYQKSNYPLNMLFELRSGLALELSYESRFVEPVVASRMLLHLETLLASIAHVPDLADVSDISGIAERRLADLAFLTAAERQQLVREANDSAQGGGPPSGCLHDEIERQAEATPERVAVTAEGVHLSYASLVERSGRLARHLLGQGVAPGDRVGLWIERSVEAIVALLATLRIGAAYVPADLEHPVERVVSSLADCGARVVLTRGRSLGTRLEEAGPAIGVIDVAATDQIPGQSAPSLPRVDPGQPAYIIYTSGSTGRPKGVVVRHLSVLNLLHGMEKRVYARSDRDGLRLSLNAPLAFDASMQQILMLCRGYSLHFVPGEVRKDGPAFVEWLVRERIEGLDITPAHLGLLLDAGLLARTDAALAQVVVAGGAINPPTWERLAGARVRFFNIYGPTEATVNATGRAIVGRNGRPSIGTPLHNYRVHLLDRRARLVPPGVAGELCIGGPGLAQGYHERPDLTAQRFVPDPFSGEPGARLYRTGDLARSLDDGELEFLGRLDNQVKVRGFRVELEEIESVLSGHPAISRVVVLLDRRADLAGEEAFLVAFYTSPGRRDLEREDVRAFARRQLPDYMVPNELVRLDELPLLPSGKVARDRLPGIAAALRQKRVGPRNPREERLLTIWSEVLGADPESIGVLEDFLSLGGHSLNAIQLVSRMRRELGAEISLKALLKGATISDLAALVEDDDAQLLESEQAEKLLGELQNLTPEEIQSLLEQERQATAP